MLITMTLCQIKERTNRANDQSLVKTKRLDKTILAKNYIKACAKSNVFIS